MRIRALYQRYKLLLPILVLIIFCISTLSTSLQEAATLNKKHYAGFLVVGIALVTFFLRPRYYKYCLLLIFGIGLFRLINFTVAEVTIGASVAFFKLGLDPVLALFGLLIYLQHNEQINESVLKTLRPSEARLAEIQRQEIAVFKERFSQKSSKELTEIVAANKLVPAAIEASRQLLAERKAASQYDL